VDDTRELDSREYAEHMRRKRGGDTPPVVDYGRGEAGDGDYMAWIEVSTEHPWAGKPVDECPAGGAVTVADLMRDDDTHEAEWVNGRWLVSIFVPTRGRAEAIYSQLVHAAKSILPARQDGLVTSSR
jgi:hypothetical protein